MKQRFYLDTSVFRGVFAKEFDELTLQLLSELKWEKSFVFILS